MNYSEQKFGKSLLFLSRVFFAICLLLCCVLRAQDSLQSSKMHIEGGAVIYSHITSFNKKLPNYSKDSKNSQKEASKGKKRKKKGGLSDQLEKIERQKREGYKTVQKNRKNLQFINLLKSSNSFLFFSSSKSCLFVVYDSGLDTADITKSYRAKKKEFWLQKISKIHFKSTFLKSSEFAFSCFSRPPPSLG